MLKTSSALLANVVAITELLDQTVPWFAKYWTILDDQPSKSSVRKALFGILNSFNASAKQPHFANARSDESSYDIKIKADGYLLVFV